MNNRQWKSLGLAYFALVALLTPTLASAYIDPSVTSYVLQAVVGVAVAAGAFFAVYWRRTKKKLQEKLNLQDHGKKVQEADVEGFDDSHTHP